MYCVGIDLGTSSVKAVLMDENKAILRTVSREYPLLFPKNGWSEQNPEDWWAKTCEALKKLVGDDRDRIATMSFSGQMHGLVVLDSQDRVIRPAILWNDGRAEAETRYLNEEIGEDVLAAETGNIAFAGFTAPKILWMKRNEPELFARIRRIMLPKDYLAYRLTGVHSTDYSDASGTLLLDVEHKCWSGKMLSICGITNEQLPELHESSDVVGFLTPKAAEETGLSTKVAVAAGAGDNAAAAIGMGIVSDGMCNLSLGTSGTVFISSDTFKVTNNHSIHVFAHANGKYHLMGCMLSAAVCNQWWMEQILQTAAYDYEQALVSHLGENTVLFAPYLMGERTPHNDTKVRGAFFGLSLATSRAEMLQAVLEGVAFALRDSLEVAEACGMTIHKVRLCGGGAKSELWGKILANVLSRSLEILETEDGAARGAAILAWNNTFRNSKKEMFSEENHLVKQVIVPQSELIECYRKQYEKFRLIYPLLRRFSRETAGSAGERNQVTDNREGIA